MPEVAFYHLTLPLERTLPRLLERALEQGRRVAIRGDAARLKALDEMLWTYDDASFLPHAREGEFAEQQPVLLTEGEGAPANGADVLIVFETPVPAFEGRVIYMFDAANIAAGRAAWRELEGVERTYWQQDERGRWEKKA